MRACRWTGCHTSALKQMIAANMKNQIKNNIEKNIKKRMTVSIRQKMKDAQNKLDEENKQYQSKISKDLSNQL